MCFRRLIWESQGPLTRGGGLAEGQLKKLISWKIAEESSGAAPALSNEHKEIRGVPRWMDSTRNQDKCVTLADSHLSP